MIDADAFVPAKPREIARTLADSIHLWRLPWRRESGRAPLLDLLAAYLGVQACTLTLVENKYGKPRLAGTPTLNFNWSHSGSVALVALAKTFEVGVDVEQARPGVRTLELAQRFFSSGEADALAACDEIGRDDAFLQLWCAKEAVLKALGRGLAFGLERVAFAHSDRGWVPARFDAEAGEPAAWRIADLRPAVGCAGALAWRGPPAAVIACSLAGS